MFLQINYVLCELSEHKLACREKEGEEEEEQKEKSKAINQYLQIAPHRK